MTEQTATQAVTPVSDAPPTPEAQLATLQQERIAGTVTDRTYWERRDAIDKAIESGAKTVAPPAPAQTVDQQLEAIADQAMEGCAPEDYEIHEQTDSESTAVESHMREVFATAKIPKGLGSQIYAEVDQTARRFEGAPPQAIEGAIQTTRSALVAAWGDDTPKRIQAISDFVDGLADRSPYIAALLDNAPHVIAASPVVMQALDRIVQHQGKRR